MCLFSNAAKELKNLLKKQAPPHSVPSPACSFNEKQAISH